MSSNILLIRFQISILGIDSLPTSDCVAGAAAPSCSLVATTERYSHFSALLVLGLSRPFYSFCVDENPPQALVSSPNFVPLVKRNGGLK